MSEFALWFWRPIAEFLGTVALVGALVAVAVIAFILYTLYITARQKYCTHDWFSCNGQWQPPKWRCRKCELETSVAVDKKGAGT